MTTDQIPTKAQDLERLEDNLRDAMHAKAVRLWKERNGVPLSTELLPSETRDAEVERIYDFDVSDEDPEFQSIWNEILDLQESIARDGI